ncbi:MAG: hypothetical protein LBD15_02125 [Holosporales bacterium]|nr:hypothetical protein [Holosporales bacterium]
MFDKISQESSKKTQSNIHIAYDDVWRNAFTALSAPRLPPAPVLPN